MSYVVLWRKNARDELTNLWLYSPDRNDITSATAKIDTLLADSPLYEGYPLRSSVHRRLSVPPLGVLYEVIEDDKRVIVLAVFEMT